MSVAGGLITPSVAIGAQQGPMTLSGGAKVDFNELKLGQLKELEQKFGEDTVTFSNMNIKEEKAVGGKTLGEIYTV